MIRPALERLSQAGVPFATRGEQPVDDPPPGGDVDLLVQARHARAAGRVLQGAGFHPLRAPGHRGHRFYLAFDCPRSRWLKIDLNLVPARLGWDLSARDAESLRRFAEYRVGTRAAPGFAERAWSAVAWRRPVGWTRRGAVVAVLGPDGAGKGSVIAALRAEIPVTVTPLYMGNRSEPRHEHRAAQARAGAARRLRAAISVLPDGARATQYRLRHTLRSAARVWVAHLYAWRGDIVLCDRHPVDALVLDRGRGGLGSVLERGALGRLFPWPDAIVILDAPGDVMFARKGEHSPELLERRRQGYRETFEARGATIVSNTESLEDAVAAASAVVWQALRERRQW